jgi:hypothetical protein
MKRFFCWTGRRTTLLVGVVFAVGTLAVPAAIAVHGGDREVTVGSNDAIFSQNKQNEPAVAINPVNPSIVAAGANDNIDMEACNAGADNTCPFTPDVGGSGIQFSFNRGDTWTQPTYSGISARGCLGTPGNADPACAPDPDGLIGTLPRYDEVNLVSDGDPALAWGPKPNGSGGFTYANGARLYFANLASSVSASFGEPPFKGFEALAISRTDDPAGAAAGNESAWKLPVILSKQSSATFSDKEQLWADNAESSAFFGNVYVCYARFQGGGAAPLYVATSRDGGDTWANQKVSPSHNVSAKHFGQSGCSVRTDSRGTAYVFYEEFQNPGKVGFPPAATHKLVQSFDGGRSWTKPRTIQVATDPCFRVDPVIGRCVMDGIAGARSDLAAAPSVDIANGAPTGAGATDFIAVAWVDGRDGLNNEDVMVIWSRNRGESFSAPLRVSSSPDRGYYAAPAVSPDGKDLYVVYNAFMTPFRETTAMARTLVGVVKHAEIGATGAPSNWTELRRGTPGDPRASSQNDLQAEFLGDYVYASATNDFAVAVWNDARNAADCGEIDTWRQALRDNPAAAGPAPAPQLRCASNWGNTDIFGWSGADPTTP